MRDEISRFIHKCSDSEASPFAVALRYAYYRLHGLSILAAGGVRIIGLNKIRTGGLLQVGLSRTRFVTYWDRTLIRVRGQLSFRSGFAVGRGCRFDIGPEAEVSFGQGYVNAQSMFVIMHGLTVGDRCAISWGCQFLDEDFHKIEYPGKRCGMNPIVIGDRVWIGSNVTVLKGAVIPDGCVVAAHSVVTSRFDTPNALIAGNPAKVIRQGVSWE